MSICLYVSGDQIPYKIGRKRREATLKRTPVQNVLGSWGRTVKRRLVAFGFMLAMVTGSVQGLHYRRQGVHPIPSRSVAAAKEGDSRVRSVMAGQEGSAFPGCGTFRSRSTRTKTFH